ncbi:hypothetical protein DK389_09815 [Methylobacterium durans]|uniref:Uncharacterized protein n=2 Tax=Methylobacterium durans TaxID=2202825 RepID=A0A2U8W3X3_9HYPH|nr:hypothetical protein DK389_09815 [Methylobacterium durans]
MARRLGRTFRWEGAIDGTEGSHNWTDGDHYLPSGAHHIWDLADVAHKAANKAIDQMTLADYRRGVARLRGTL